ERVACYATMLSAKLGMSESEQKEIYELGLLHDVGKIGVHEDIINKPSRLTDEEFEQIKAHTTVGYEILTTITELPSLATGARWHHEKYDGTGYPDGKKGEDIPLAARIICVADCYDAMTSSRSYSDPRPQEKVRAEFERCKGKQFDPEIADLMIALIDADKDYCMNEKGYYSSAVAKYVEDLVKRVSLAGYQETAKSEVSLEEEEEEEEKLLPGWLRNNDSLDAEAGVRNCGSVKGYLSILKNFYASAEEKASEIERFYQEKDLENYTIKVHALKSSARIIGAMKLSEKARRLEEAGDAKDRETIRQETTALLDLLRSYKEQLAPIKNQGRDLPEADEATVEDAYSALAEFAEVTDYSMAWMVLDAIDEYRLKPKDRSRFDRLRSAVARMDWDQVHAIIEEE
nr:HD domain-containing protein [Lachnospiraceae bacterium]